MTTCAPPRFLPQKGGMGDLGSIYTSVPIKRWTDWAPYVTEEVVFNWAADFELIAGIASDADAMLGTVGFAKTLNEDKNGKTEAAVYVISAEGYPDLAKIGMSTNPVERLAQLQAAHWAPLSIHALLWSPTRQALTVEQAALAIASMNGKRLMGEWVKMTPDEAVLTVLNEAKEHDVPLCDSRTWIANWKLRVQALHQARLHVKTAAGRKVPRSRLYRAA